MALPRQTLALLKAASELRKSLPADAVLLLTETNLDWDAVRAQLGAVRTLVAADKVTLAEKIRQASGMYVVELDAAPIPTQEKMSVAILKAIAAEQLQPGSHVVVVYNGIGVEEGDRPEPMDSLSVIHLSEHLERMSAHDLRKLGTQVPLETLRLVVDLAMEIGREGREGHPVGTILVVGDHRRVLSMSRPINFNPFKGYSEEERDLRDRRVREQIKDLAQLDGAIVVRRDGIAVAACLYLDVPADEVTLARGLGSRHIAAAAVSRKTNAVAVCVSQSSGTVRLFQNGEVVLHLEPLARPHVWQPFRLETHEADGSISAKASE
jgi:DNA integrity scanning protein DisA with diadenylate cyclase activity